LLAIHGISGVSRLFIAKFIGLMLWLTPARRRARAMVRELDLQFDNEFGVDTSGMVIPDQADVIGSRWIHGSRYQAVDADSLGQILIELGLNYEQFTFIDLGSGKGRAVLLASQFPFRKIIGVEYSEGLNDIARKNLATFRTEHRMHCSDIDLVWDDALNYPIPAGPIVIFMYNPFGQSVMSELVRKVEAAFENEQRRIIVVYFHAIHGNLWRESGFLDEIRSSMAVSVFDSHGAGRAAGGSGNRTLKHQLPRSSDDRSLVQA
jgi:hypothetical protein